MKILILSVFLAMAPVAPRAKPGAAAGADDLWVLSQGVQSSDGSHNALLRLRPDGTLRRLVRSQADQPWQSFTVLPGGDLAALHWVDSFAVIDLVPADGWSVSTTIVPQVHVVYGDLDSFPDGTLCLLDGWLGRVYRLDLGGHVLASWNLFQIDDPLAEVHVDAGGEVWVPTPEDVQHYDGQGQLLDVLGIASTDLTSAPDGSLWSHLPAQTRIYHYDRSGNLLGGFYAANMQYVLALAVASDGTLWLAPHPSQAVLHLDPHGQVLESLTLPAGVGALDLDPALAGS